MCIMMNHIIYGSAPQPFWGMDQFNLRAMSPGDFNPSKTTVISKL